MPAVGVGTNIAALKAQRRLSESSGLFSKSMERLASGLRINRASDDAAGLAISSALNTNSRVFGQAVRNVNDGISYLAIAQGALGQLSDIVIRQRELAEQAANGVFSAAQRTALNLEANRLVDEYNRIIEGTEFNGKRILQDLEDGEEIRIQAGYGVAGSLSLSLLSTSTTTSGGGDGTFATAITYDSLRGGDMEAGDINGDGNLDLFVASSATASLHVMLGNADGSFQARLSYSTSDSSLDQIVVADFNDDSILDVIVSSYYGGSGHQILFGNSNGSLTAPTAIAGSGGYLTSGDFNGDGRTDIVSAGSSGGPLTIRISNGNGTFAISSNFNLPDSPNDVTVGYFNNDSYLDIAQLETNGGSQVLLYTGNGNGTFTRQTGSYIATGSQIFKADVQTADFNGDGNADLVTTITDGVSVNFGNGDGSFTINYDYTTTASVNDYGSIAIADFNGDNIKDLAVVNSSATGSVSVLIGNSNGSFKGKTDYSLFGGTAPAGVLARDFDDDGVTDIAVTHNLLDQFHILLGNGEASSSTTTTGITLTASSLNLLSASSARSALDTLATRQQEITSTIGKFGAFESRLQVASNVLNVIRDNYTTASSRIKDADIASESAQVIRSRILQQASSAVLAQANQVPALALTLLRG